MSSEQSSGQRRPLGLGTKLLLFTGLLTTGVILSAFAALSFGIKRNTERAFVGELSKSHQALRGERESDRLRLLSIAALVTESPTLRAALQTLRVESAFGDDRRPELVATLQRELDKIALVTGRDLLIVTDERGRVLAATYDGSIGPAVGHDLSRLPAIGRALDPRAAADEASYAVVRFGESDYQAEVAPIVLQNFAIGTLLLGDRLDEEFVDALQEHFDSEIVVASETTVHLSTLRLGDWVGSLKQGAATLTDDRPMRLAVGQEEFLVTALGLGLDEARTPVTLYMMRSLTRALEAPQRELFLSFWVLCGLAVIGALGASAVASRSFISKVNRDAQAQKALEARLASAQKLESIGQLAAGIAHEINTPTQYVGDNTRFFEESFRDLAGLIVQLQCVVSAARTGPVPEELLDNVEGSIQQVDLAYLLDEIPRAIEQSLEGVDRVTTIVRAMKEFSHVSTEKTPTDLNAAIRSTVTVASNEWRYVADVVTEFDEELPLASCVPGEFNQVILNLVVNASHAIADVLGEGADERGTITIRTRRVGGWAEVTVRDTGCGMTEDLQTRIFDPFYTTKAVGKGTGQGLTIVHSVVVKRHGGTISVDSDLGQGTTFTVRLPLNTTTTERVAA